MKSIAIDKASTFYKDRSNNKDFLKEDGELIERYTDLRRKVAELSCLYPHCTLFFRGQKGDYRDEEDRSTLQPNIYRNNPNPNALSERWDKLNYATRLFDEEIKSHPDYRKDEFRYLKLKQLAKWSILQHYEVCDTPLLDVSQSLRVACSFAELSRQEEEQYGYIYVLALPYPTGRISINSEQYITNIRLLSVTPSSARRPHNQEGFLIGEDFIQQQAKASPNTDFAKRVVGKYKIHLKSDEFWKIADGIYDRALTRKEIYPDEGKEVEDHLAIICNGIKEKVKIYKSPKEPLSTFLEEWATIEKYLKGLYREFSHRDDFTLTRAINFIKDVEHKRHFHNTILNEVFTPDASISQKLSILKRQRNELVHSFAKDMDIDSMIESANFISDQLRKIPDIESMAKIWSNRN